jgi:membrane protein required for colicin V production
MQAYDIVMLVILAAATLFGMVKGFAWQIASLASIIVSYFVAYNFRDEVAARIQVNPPMNTFIAMLLLYAGSSFVIWVVFRLVSGSIDQVRLKEFDRQMGALFGLGKGIIYCLLITMFAMTLLGDRQRQAIITSKSGNYINRFLSSAQGVVLPKEIDSVIRPYLDRMKHQLDGTAPMANGSAFPSFGGGQSGSNPSFDQLKNQIGEIAGGLINQANGNGNNQAPFGIPTSQQNFDPNAIGNAIETARDMLPWPNQNGSAGQGGWNGSAGAPLPNGSFFGNGQTLPPSTSAPSNGFTNPFSTPQFDPNSIR